MAVGSMCVYLLIASMIIYEIQSKSSIHQVRELKYRNKKFPCNKPQLRCIPVSDLVNTTAVFKKFQGAEFEPACVVLHRCESAGCCRRKNQTCSPYDDREVELTVKIKQQKKPDRWHTFTAADPESCSCQNYDYN